MPRVYRVDNLYHALFSIMAIVSLIVPLAAIYEILSTGEINFDTEIRAEGGSKLWHLYIFATIPAIYIWYAQLRHYFLYVIRGQIFTLEEDSIKIGKERILLREIEAFKFSPDQKHLTLKSGDKFFSLFVGWSKSGRGDISSTLKSHQIPQISD